MYVNELVCLVISRTIHLGVLRRQEYAKLRRRREGKNDWSSCQATSKTREGNLRN